MSLLQNWRDIAYNQEADKKQLQQFWTNYFLIEKNIYEQLLSNPDEVVKGTVKELAEKYKVDVMTMVGFLDGINDSLVIPNPIEEMEERILLLRSRSIRRSCTGTWLRPRQTGCTTCRCGMRSSQKSRRKRFTWSRKNPAL